VTVEVDVGGQIVHRVVIDRTVVFGREGDVVIDDPQVSRRHLELAPAAGDRFTVRDLGSANGTYVDGARISGVCEVGPASIITLGTATVRPIGSRPTERVSLTPPPPAAPPPAAPPPAAPPPAAPPPAAPPPPPPVTPAATTARPDLDQLAQRSGAGVVVRFRPGTAGAAAADGVLAAAEAVRRRLAGFGNESWGVPVQICLVDPFPDPGQPDLLVSEGTVVDAARGEVWMVVDEVHPAGPVGGALALVLGSAFPAADELAPLLVGYGLHVGGADDPTPDLRGRRLGRVSEAAGALAPAMSVGFVRFLLDGGGDDAVRRFFASARPGGLDDAARATWGAGLDELEAAWRAGLLGTTPAIEPTTFLRLSLKYLRPHLRRQIEIFVYLLLSLGFTTVLPFVTQRLLDTAIPSGEWSQVAQLLLVLAVTFAVSLLGQVRQQYLSSFVSSSIVRSVRGGMFERMQDLDAGWYARHDQGDVLSRFFSDVDAVETGLSTLLRDGLFQMITLAVSLAICFTLDWRLALVTAVGAPVIAFVYRRMRNGAMQRSMAMQQESGGLMTVAAESFQAQQVVKAFSLHAREVARFDAAAGRVFDSEMRMSLFGGWFTLSVQSVVTLLRLATMGLGAWLILEGQLTVGAFVAFLGVMGQVLEPVAGLTTLGQQLQHSMGALARVQEVMDAVPEVRDVPDAQPLSPLRSELRLQGVTFGYTPEHQVLRGVDLVLRAGTRTAIVGPSGSGKSSILQLLLRAYDPDGGSVTWDGTDIAHARLADLRQHTGVVFQDNFAFDDTIRENIRLGRPGATDAEIEAAARVAEFHDVVLGLPKGYDTVVGERGGLLSGGQRQRLAIARALLRDPSLLVLDEATSALDPRTERLISATLDRASQGRTTVAVTHRLGTVTGYDQIVVVVEGRIVEHGTHAELLRAQGSYAAMWAEQGGTDSPPDTPPVGPASGARVTRLVSAIGSRYAPPLLPPPPPAGLPAPVPASRATGTFGTIR
jgi:ATP-binding cassette subfamily B protein